MLSTDQSLVRKDIYEVEEKQTFQFSQKQEFNWVVLKDVGKA